MYGWAPYASGSRFDDIAIAKKNAMLRTRLTCLPSLLHFANPPSSDHGDMDMEQQQFYKMVPYEASTRVPLGEWAQTAPACADLYSF